MSNSVTGIPATISAAISRLQFFTKDGYIGFVWYLVDSFIIFMIFMYLRNIVVLADVENYPLYLFVGIAMFNFFRKATIQPLHAVKKWSLGEQPTVRKCVSVSATAVVHVMFLHCFEIVFFAVIASFYAIPAIWTLLYIPIFLLSALLYWCIAGILLFLKTKWSNIKNVWMLCLRVLFLVTPIFHSVTFLGLAKYNPMYHIITSGRQTIMQGSLTISLFALCCLCVVVTGFLFIKKAK